MHIRFPSLGERGKAVAGPAVTQYLRRHSYDRKASSAHFLSRMFLECWLESGVNRLWRVWNPLYGFFLYRLYLRLWRLGGNYNRSVATVGVFVACKFGLHDFSVSLVLEKSTFVCTSSFSVWTPGSGRYKLGKK